MIKEIRSSEGLVTGTVVMWFTAVWCVPCRSIKPVLESMEAANEALIIKKIDVDTNPALVDEYKISSVPTLVVIKDNVVVERIIGAKPKAVLVDILKEFL